jgi:hypothetical protein
VYYFRALCAVTEGANAKKPWFLQDALNWLLARPINW